MSDVLADPTGTETGFLPRSQEAAAFRVAQGMERERRLRRFVTVAGGWVFGGAMTAVAVACLGVMLHRPVPLPQLAVAIVHDNGTYEPPVMRDDLPKGRFDVLLSYTAQRYVEAREAYSWEGAQTAYTTASVMSAPDEQARYQALMNDGRNPDNPAVIYGKGPGAARTAMVAVKINLDPASNNMLTADLMLKVMGPGPAVRLVRRRAQMTWTPAERVIPIEMQQQYDPAAIQFTSYSSYTVDDGGVK